MDALPRSGVVDSCRYGHEWTANNEYWHNGYRSCRECRRIRSREYQRAAREVMRAERLRSR